MKEKLGYCPGTGVSALGDGSRHAAFGILGMLAGAALYAEVYPLLKGNLLAFCNLGKVTLPEVTGLSPWLFVVILFVMALVLFAILKSMDSRSTGAE